MEQARKLNGKVVDPFPPYLKEFSEKNQLYIFNVRNKAWDRSMGDYGSVHIPACEEGKEVSEAYIVDGAPHGYIATDMHKMSIFLEPGGAIALAMDILFIGRGFDPMLNGENKGLFISDTAKPSAAAIKTAKAKLRKWQMQLSEEGDNLDRNNKRHEITDMHREAAAALGLNKSWMVQEPREVANCPACQKSMDVEAVKCTSCNAIVDWERAAIYYPIEYAAYKASQAA
jgi:endogenous inhibitor of DNA gyrase (YacG/DUF329 family)